MPELPLREGAYLEHKQDLGCHKESRKMYTVWAAGNIEGCWVPSVHTNCNHNETHALLKRSLAPTPCADKTERIPVLKWFRKLRYVAKRFGGERWSHLETAQSYTGLLRRRYLEAERSLREDGPITRSDSKLAAFLKAEKFGAAKYGKPRMIFPRSPRYNLQLASWLKPFEHWLWGYLTAKRFFGGSNTRIVAKGLNMTQRANLIVRKFKSFADCVVFEVDGAAFEAHVDVWQLKKEHEVYLAAYGSDPELAATLARQLVNEGTTPGGVKFSRAGGRASGDFNTGMGNTLIMSAVVVAVLKHLNVPFDVLVDGDNALVFMPQSVSARVVECFAPLALRISGHEMVLENPVNHIEGIRFGQSAPVQVQKDKWTMVRDWRKVVSQMTSNHANLVQPKFCLPYLRGVGFCELSLHKGVPVSQNLARRLVHVTEGAKAVGAHFYREYEAMGVGIGSAYEARFSEPSSVARQSFYLAFGLDPEEQIEVERRLDNAVINVERWDPEDSPWKFGSYACARPGLAEGWFDEPDRGGPLPGVGLGT